MQLWYIGWVFLFVRLFVLTADKNKALYRHNHIHLFLLLSLTFSCACESAVCLNTFESDGREALQIPSNLPLNRTEGGTPATIRVEDETDGSVRGEEWDADSLYMYIGKP